MPIWITITEWLARIILAGLIGLSVWSIGIIIEQRKRHLSLKIDDLKASLQAKIQGLNSFQNTLNYELFELKSNIESGLSNLATLGSVTPFIGLLGTILGIIVAFGELSMKKSGTNAIMYALAEALILTAVGLVVAIPAVIAFNHYKRKSSQLITTIESSILREKEKEQEQKN